MWKAIQKRNNGWAVSSSLPLCFCLFLCCFMSLPLWSLPEIRQNKCLSLCSQALWVYVSCSIISICSFATLFHQNVSSGGPVFFFIFGRLVHSLFSSLTHSLYLTPWRLITVITEGMEMDILQGKICSDGGMNAHRRVMQARLGALGSASQMTWPAPVGKATGWQWEGKSERAYQEKELHWKEARESCLLLPWVSFLRKDWWVNGQTNKDEAEWRKTHQAERVVPGASAFGICPLRFSLAGFDCNQ